ncbi:MAG: hypothetical protein ABI855_00835 [Bacteroidota bacterium]
MITRLDKYIPAKEYAKKRKLKPRTIHDQIRRKELPYIIVCGNKMICENIGAAAIEHAHVPISKLEWVHRFARKRKYSPDTIYQQIILDKINAVTIGNMVMVNPEDETVISFLKNNPPLKR